MRVFTIRGSALAELRTVHPNVESLQLVFEAGEDERGPPEPVGVRLLVHLKGVHPDLGDPVQQKAGLLGQWRVLSGANAIIFRPPEAGQLQRRSAQDYEEAVEVAAEKHAGLDADLRAPSQRPAELITEPADRRHLIPLDATRVEKRPPSAVDDFTGEGILSRPVPAQRFNGGLAIPDLPRLVTVVVQELLEAVQGEDDVTALAGAAGGTKPLP